MHRLFTIDHLVHEICSHVKHSELPVVARVSSTWFHCAIPHLYKDLSLKQALASLGKTVKPENRIKQVEFVNTPDDKTFKRFLIYAPHVRNISIDIEYISITLEVMRKALSLGVPYLFPNARYIRWERVTYSKEHMEVSTGLISPKVNRLLLYVKNRAILPYLCQLIMTRLPVLRSLTITERAQTDDSQSSTESPAQDLLAFFTHTLTSVYISRSLSTPAAIQCLSKMPNLRSLTIVDDNSEEGSQPAQREDKTCEEERAGFASLRSFSFDGSSRSFHDNFLKPYGLASLTTLSITTIYGENMTPADVRMYISSIVVAIPRIKSVSFALGTPSKHTIPWSFIQPISACKELDSLSFERMHVLVNSTELTEFLKSRTTWRRLHILNWSGWRLKTMLIYAEHCPNLEHLGIYIREVPRFLPEDLPVDPPRFSILTSIDFGQSMITKSTASTLAQFLYRICKKLPYQIYALQMPAINEVFKHLAVAYIDEQCRTGNPMSDRVREFVRMMVTNSSTNLVNQGLTISSDEDDSEAISD